MEFLLKNFVNTTTQITVDSATFSVVNMLSRDTTNQYISSGYNSNTTTSIVFTFNETVSVSKIAVMGINWKSFRIFHSGVTANTFALTSTSATTTTHFTTNSESSMFFTVPTTALTTITIDATESFTGASEKAVGYVLISDLLMDFDRLPASKNYKPVFRSKEITHKLSDGLSRVNVMGRYRETTIKYKNISQSFVDKLKVVYELRDSFVFAAFPTTTSWDEWLFPCSWAGDFKFYEYSDDFVEAGFQGEIKLVEVNE